MLKYTTLFILFSAFGISVFSDPPPAEKHYKSAIAYHAIDEFEQAVAEYKKAIAINPNSAIIYNRLGVAYAELKQYDAALEGLSDSIGIVSHDG